jgi:hypothetical protein
MRAASQPSVRAPCESHLNSSPFIDEDRVRLSRMFALAKVTEDPMSDDDKTIRFNPGVNPPPAGPPPASPPPASPPPANSPPANSPPVGPMPAGPSVWTTPAAPQAEALSHSYPLAVRDHSLGAAISLLMQSLPYALARFGILLACAVVCIIWIVVAFGGAAFLANHIAGVFGLVWLVTCLGAAGFLWGTILRYILHLLACGHVAVLTELIIRGEVGNGSESMLAYGRRVVTERFGQVNALFALNLLVRGVLSAFHRTLDWIGQMLPIPGLEGIAKLIDIIMRAATRYLDKVILSYNLARGGDPWLGARNGMVYYAQNAMPILKTAVWIVILERVLTVVLWLLLLAPAAAITVMLPSSVREAGGIVTILVAAILAGPLRAAFLKPLFLIMMMVRFHALIENQPLNQEWDARLATISDKFRDLGTQAATSFAQSTPFSWPGGTPGGTPGARV